MYRNGKWQIVAGQMFRYYEDPAPGKADIKKYGDYVGTYELAPGVTQTISVRDGGLYAQREEQPGRRTGSRVRPTYSFARAWKAGVCSGEPITARSMP